MNLPGEQSLTLPTRGRNRARPSLDDSALNQSYRSSRSSHSSVTSQEGYLENMFRKESEVDDRMNNIHDGIEEESEDEYDGPKRRSAQVYNESLSDKSESSQSSESESEEEITLPKVRLKNIDTAEAEASSVYSTASAGPEQTHFEGHPISELESDVKSDTKGDNSIMSGAPSTGSNVEINNDTNSDVFVHSASPSEYTSELDRIIARENSRSKSITLNSQGTSDGHTSTHTSSSSLGYQGKSAQQRAYERGSTDSMSGSRRRISPQEHFSFTSQVSVEESQKQRRKAKPYAKGWYYS